MIPYTVLFFPDAATKNLFLGLVESSPSTSCGNSTFYWCSWFTVTDFYTFCVCFFLSVPLKYAFKWHVGSVHCVMWPWGLEVCFSLRHILRRAHYLPFQITCTGVSSCSEEQLPGWNDESIILPPLPKRKRWAGLLRAHGKENCLLENSDYFKSKMSS